MDVSEHRSKTYLIKWFRLSLCTMLSKEKLFIIRVAEGGKVFDCMSEIGTDFCAKLSWYACIINLCFDDGYCGIILAQVFFILRWCHHQSWFYLPRALHCIILSHSPSLCIKVMVVGALHCANIDWVASMVSWISSGAI